MAVSKAGLIKYWLPVWLCAGLIFYSSSISGSDILPLFPYQDAIFHFFIYLLLGLSFARALHNTYPNIVISKIIVFTIIFGIIYGISDEFHQAFVPYRTVSGFDVFVDGVGTFLGSLIRACVKISEATTYGAKRHKLSGRAYPESPSDNG